MRIIISQPMKGLPTEEIRKRKEAVVNEIVEKGHKVVNTIFTEDPPKDCNQGLWFLAKSLEAIADCDAVFFMSGWERARGCKLEYEACKQYGVQIITSIHF
jgi:hypothetical protein